MEFMTILNATGLETFSPAALQKEHRKNDDTNNAIISLLQAQYFPPLPNCLDRDDGLLTDPAQWPAVPSEYTSHSPPAGSKQLWDPCQPPCCKPNMIMRYCKHLNLCLALRFIE